MFRKTRMLGIAVGLIAALGLTTTASAEWTHHNSPLAQNVQFALTGNVKFETGFGGGQCQVKLLAQLTAGTTTGHIWNFGSHPTDSTTNCIGFSNYAFCQTHNLSPTEMPGTIHTGSVEGTPVMIITTGQITAQVTGQFCPGKFIRFTGGTLIATPNQPNTFSSVQLSGKLLTHKQTGGGAVDTEDVTITGTLNVEAPNASTYSL